MKEINWIDWVKFLCMFFVYWCHVGTFSTNGCPFYVPYNPFFVNAFFFVSGYLIFRKQLSEPSISQDRSTFISGCVQKQGMLSNILFKIAIPSVIFSIIDYLPKSIIRGETLSLQSFLIDTMVRGTNWFTCSLCVAELILVLLLITRLKNVWCYLGLCLPFIVLGIILINNNSRVMEDSYLPWFYKSGFVALFFMACGGIYHKYEKIFDCFVQKFGGRIFSITAVIAFCILTTFTSARHWRTSLLENIDIKVFILGLIAIFVIVYLCKQLKPLRLVKYVSRHTIGFYFLSASVPFLWCVVTSKFIQFETISFYIGVIGAFFTALIIVYILNRFLPFLFDLRKLWQ